MGRKSFRGERQRRAQTRWTGANATVNAQPAGTAGRIILAASTRRDTILRTRGEAVVYIDSVQAPGVSALISLGLIVVPEGTGTTVLQSPFTDANADWFWFEQVTISYEEMVVDVVDVPGMSSARLTVDSKAMRIGVPDTEVQFVVENTTLTSAVSVNVSFTARFLLMES